MLSKRRNAMTLDRREFLADLAVVGAATLLGSDTEATQQAAHHKTRRYRKPVIDAHTHWYPPEFVRLIEQEGAANGVTNIHRNENGDLQAVVPGAHPYAPRA